MYASPSRQVPARLPSAGYERNVPSPSGGKRDPATPSRIVRKGTPPTAQMVALPDPNREQTRVQVPTGPIPHRRSSVDSPFDEVEECVVGSSAPGSMHVRQPTNAPVTRTPPRNSPKPESVQYQSDQYEEIFESDSEEETPRKQQPQQRPQAPAITPGRPSPSKPAAPEQRSRDRDAPPTAGHSSTPHTAPTKAREMFNINISKKELVGRGSFGTVYKGIDEDTDRIVAVKEIILAETEMKDLKKQVHQLEREIRVMQKLSHPNIVQYLGAKRKGVELHIYMEYVTGGTIAQLLRTFGPMKEAQAARYTRQLLSGLGYLHERKIAHRDLKGDNLFTETNGVLKLGDFGTSKELQTFRMTDSVAGTPNFMAPEVIQCSGHSIEADIWSVGCCVIQMLTGHPPFHTSDNHLAVMFKVSKGEIDSEIPPDLTPEALDFLRLCFAKEPKERASSKKLLSHPWIERARIASAERGVPSAMSQRRSTPPPVAPGRQASKSPTPKSVTSTPSRTPNGTPPPAAGDRRQNATPTRSSSKSSMMRKSSSTPKRTPSTGALRR